MFSIRTLFADFQTPEKLFTLIIPRHYLATNSDNMDFMNEKVPAGSVVANGLNEDPNGIPVLSQEKAGTTFDQRDMARVGKTQELRVSTSPTLRFYSWGIHDLLNKRGQRNFGFFSILGFTATLMCTWESAFLCVPSKLRARSDNQARL